MVRRLAAVLALGLALGAGTGRALAGSPTVPALEAAKTAGERQRVSQLIDRARQEGALEWIGVFIEPSHAEQILRRFKEYYGLTTLRTTYTYVGTGELVTRIEQLLAARKNNFDIVWTSAWAWYMDLLNRGEILQYPSPYYREYTLSHSAGLSMPGYWVSDAYTFSPLYNPEALRRRGIEFNPTSWMDFTDPRLRGLVSIGDAMQSTSYAQTALGLKRALGEGWLSALATKVRPVLFTKTAQGRDWVASGEFPITLMSHAKDAMTLKNRNVPVKLVYPKEGVVLLPFAPIILAKAPHPNAARLFIDFVRSQVGAQTVMDSGAYMLFGRPGVRSPVPELLPGWEDIQTIPMDWTNDGTEEALQEIREAWSAAGLGS